MSLSQPPPILPEAEEQNCEPEQAEHSVEPESILSQFRFSLTRLIVATVAAPLPLLLSDPHQGLSLVCFLIGGVGLFGAILSIRARDLPFLNLIVSILAAEVLFIDAQNIMALIAIPIFLAVLIVRWGYRAKYGDAVGPTRCVWVLYSGVFSFAYCNAAVLWMLDDLRTSPIPAPIEMTAASLIRVCLGLFWVINLYWAASDRRETLDQRPWLGVYYETTMVVLPCAALIIFTYVMQSELY